MKILHLWDQCNYVRNMKNYKLDGISFGHFPKFSEYGLMELLMERNYEYLTSMSQKIPSKNYTSAINRLRLRSIYVDLQTKYINYNSKKNVMFEVHDFQILERFPELAHRFIFHVHGSELRKISHNGEIVEIANEVTKFGLSNSALTLYSTPDLSDIVRKYSMNAAWIPHPLKNITIGKTQKNKRPYIYFPNSWDMGKGAASIIELMANYRNRNSERNLQLVGLNFGEYRNEAKKFLDIVLEPANRKKHLQRISNAHAVVGQGLGFFGVSDIESMLINQNFHFLRIDGSYIEAYGLEISKKSSFDVDLNRNPSEESRVIANRITETHKLREVSSRLQKAYKTLR